jgi:uncharacterized membrane protein
MAWFELLHLLAVFVWVGGMFFAHAVLRPSAIVVLEVEQRLRLWDAVLTRFFQWVWGAIGLLMITGFYMIYLHGGIAHVSPPIHLMLVLGLTMMVIYGYVFFACYVPMNVHVSKKSWSEAGAMLVKIRRLVSLNLLLGLFTICSAVIA